MRIVTISVMLKIDSNCVALHILPLDVLAKVLNPLLKSVCANSQMILMKLYSPKEVNATDSSEYMKNLRSLVKDLPPMLLMNSSTHLPVITRYIWVVSEMIVHITNITMNTLHSIKEEILHMRIQYRTSSNQII